MDGSDAGDGAWLAVWATGLQVSVSEGHEPPDHSEEHPGAKEGRGEDEEGVLPLQVHHGGENVLQKPTLEHAEKTKVSQTEQKYFSLIISEKASLFFKDNHSDFWRAR